MRRWLSASAQAASHVADRSRLWLPGALAWMVTVGWLALVVGVARPPTDAELTFLGARIVTSGAWPWNGLAIIVAVLLLVVAAIALASVAEAVLLHGIRAGAAQVGKTFVIGAICAVPLVLAAVALGAALFAIVPGEFNAPDADSSPMLRALLSLTPYVVAMLVVAVLAGATHAAAIRASAADGVWRALASAPGRLRIAGIATIAQVLALLVVRVTYLALAAILLRVLWAPIDARLAREGFGVAVVLLLVGFVAIWLCLVLAGGALHAWGSISWTRLLRARDGKVAADPQQLERGTRT